MILGLLTDVAPSTVKNHGSEAGRRNSTVAGARQQHVSALVSWYP